MSRRTDCRSPTCACSRKKSLAQFDVHRLSRGRLAIDCQADLLNHLASRFVVPLVSLDKAMPARRLNPLFRIEGQEYVMLTEAAAAVPARELGEVVASLADRAFDITGALDVLISGV